MDHPLPRLGIDRDLLRPDGVEALRELGAALAGQSRRSLELVGRDLEPRLYDQPAFLDGVRTLATGSRYARVRVLVAEVDAAVKQGHRLIELARRLTSNIEIRCLGEDDAGYDEAFLVADGVGLLYRPVASRYAGEACFNDPPRARALRRLFQGLWERSRADADLRRLHL